METIWQAMSNSQNKVFKQNRNNTLVSIHRKERVELKNTISKLYQYNNGGLEDKKK